LHCEHTYSKKAKKTQAADAPGNGAELIDDGDGLTAPGRFLDRGRTRREQAASRRRCRATALPIKASFGSPIS